MASKIKFTVEELIKLKGYCLRQQDFELACKVREIEKQYPKSKTKKIPDSEKVMIEPGITVIVTPNFLPGFVDQMKALINELK